MGGTSLVLLRRDYWEKLGESFGRRERKDEGGGAAKGHGWDGCDGWERIWCGRAEASHGGAEFAEGETAGNEK